MFSGGGGAKETMRCLITKYPEGYEGWAKENGEQTAQKMFSPTSYSFLNIHDTRP